MASSTRDTDAREGEIRLWREGDDWIAKGTQTGMIGQGSSRRAALSDLDNAVGLYRGERGTKAVDEELKAIGIDPADNTTDETTPPSEDTRANQRIPGGKEIAKALMNGWGYTPQARSGTHLKLCRESPTDSDDHAQVVIPLNDELHPETLREIMDSVGYRPELEPQSRAERFTRKLRTGTEDRTDTQSRTTDALPEYGFLADAADLSEMESDEVAETLVADTEAIQTPEFEE